MPSIPTAILFSPPALRGLRGDGQASWDFSLIKNSNVRERAKAEFRADVYNAWNHPLFNNPETGPASTAFGTITGAAGDARNWQFALKITF